MARIVIGVIVGYVLMIVLVVASLFGMYGVLGTEDSFAPESFYPSTTWSVMSMVFGLVAAIVGGIACAKIGGLPAVRALVVVIVVLGLASAIPSLAAEDPGVRAADLEAFEAMQQAVTPAWQAFAMPVIGVIGVLLGAGLIRGGANAPGAED